MGLFSLFGPTKKTILFVEDEMDIIRNYEMIFTNDKELSENYIFEVATDRKEFLAKIDKADLVVSDYHMGSFRFEEVWLNCAGKIPLTLISGEITKRWNGPTIFKPASIKIIKKAILEMANSKVVCPEYKSFNKKAS